MTATELGKTYELREITEIKIYKMSLKITVAVCKCPYDGKEVSFYVTGSTCVTSDANGDRFGARYCAGGKYYARSANPIK